MRRGSIGGFYKGGVDKLVLRKSSVTMAATGELGSLARSYWEGRILVECMSLVLSYSLLRLWDGRDSLINF